MLTVILVVPGTEATMECELCRLITEFVVKNIYYNLLLTIRQIQIWDVLNV